MPRAVVGDLVIELNMVSGANSTFTIYDNAGITSGMINSYLNEAHYFLDAHVGGGAEDASDTDTQNIVKAFEINYASARLLSSLIGIVITDGFNYSVGGLDIQRMGAKFQTYDVMIRVRLDVAKSIYRQLYDWFYVYNPTVAQGLNERGTPVTYWSVNQGRGL